LGQYVTDLFSLPGDKKRKTRTDLYRAVDADYYGFRDDEDGVLEELERIAEEKAIEGAVKEWEQLTGKRRKLESGDDDEKELSEANVFRVPSNEAIQKALLERRKQVRAHTWPCLIMARRLTSSFLP